MSTQIDVEGEGSRAAAAQGLLPCPHCGEPATMQGGSDCGYFAGCPRYCTTTFMGFHEAHAAWNTRAALQADRAAVGGATIDLDATAWDQIKQAAAESKWFPHEYYANDWHSDVCDFLRNGYATPPAAVIPAGFVLVPSRMYVDPESWEALPFIIGGPVTGPGEPYQSTTLWVGPIEQDDGSTIYGLHASSDECPEEGSVTIAEFAAPNPAQPINPAAIDGPMSGRPSDHDLERVARALHIHDDCCFTAWDELPDYGRERYRDKARVAIAALAPGTPASENDAHEDVEIRLPAEMVTLIESVAADADVTRDQAASVIAVLAIRRYAPSRDQEQA